MHYFLLALLGLLLAYAAFQAFLNANPKTLARTLGNIGGVALLLAALFFTLTGRFAVAAPLGLVALSLLGRGFGGFNPFGGNARKSTGQRSRVRTKTVEMELDHDTGEMEGRVVAGRLASRTLSSLSEGDLLGLWGDCRKSDPQAAQLLEAYLDRRFPEWRDGTAGTKAGSDGAAAAKAGAPMSVEEAYEILGLGPGASKEEVHRAHRTLMKKMHPDQGGSTYLAAKINQAKDLLLG